jgi:hypothetical protein
MPESRARKLLLICATAACVCQGISAAAQSGTPGRLPAELQSHIKSERFQIVTSVRGLPLGVRDAMRALWGSPSLDIADPGTEFNASGAGDPNLPNRRLVSGGCSSDHCFACYQLGGKVPSWRVVLFHWTPNATKFEWGGTVLRGLTKFDDVLTVVLSGNVAGPTTSW